MSYVTEIYCIKDKKTTVGLISGYTKKQAFKIYETFIYPKYRGQNIAPQFYAWLLKKNLVQSIISGDEQGKGGKKLWENLAKASSGSLSTHGVSYGQRRGNRGGGRQCPARMMVSYQCLAFWTKSLHFSFHLIQGVRAIISGSTPTSYAARQYHP